MHLSFRLPQPVREVLWFTLIGALIGAVYGHTVAMMDSAALFGFGGVPRGILTGAVTTAILFSLELALARPALAPLREMPFLVHMTIKTIVYLAIIWFALAVGSWAFPTPAETGFGMPIRRQDVVFSLAAVLVVRFVNDVSHLLGQNVLLNFITGRYHRPRIEQRVFLFIDIEASTTLAERLGDLAFHRLVNRFVIDITGPIVAAGGEIHRYVGDELIATWKLADGIADANCVKACFAALDELAARRPLYLREFGTPINCRAGLHCGPVVAGEMGSVKREIVLLGNTMNTAARIQELCGKTGERVIASATLVDLLELPSGISPRPLGDLRLRGKESDVLEKTAAAQKPFALDSPGGAAERAPAVGLLD